VKILTEEWHPFQRRHRDSSVVLSAWTAEVVLLLPTTVIWPHIVCSQCCYYWTK